jgi:iron complex outermembrane recepter protein
MSSTFPAGGTLGLVTIYGQENTRSEGLLAYEAGYRYQANRRIGVDIATFYNVYDHLGTLESGKSFFETTPAPAHLVQPLYFGNAMKGETYGAEVVNQLQSQ